MRKVTLVQGGSRLLTMREPIGSIETGKSADLAVLAVPD